MGWKLKGLAVLLALVFLAATLWQLTLLIFAALIIPSLARRSGRSGGSEEGGSRRGRRFPIRQIVAGGLILLSFVAFLEGGTLSPIFFGGLGLLLLGWDHIPGFALGGSLKPVKGSILLRTKLNPFGWAAMAEVKPITRDLGKALSGLGENIVITASGNPAIRIAIHRTAISERSAEGSILNEMEKINRGIVPVGAYLLPLDSSQSSEALREPLQPTPFREDGWAIALSTAPYDVLSVRSTKGSVRSLGLYRRAQAQEAPSPSVPQASQGFNHPPLLWEVLKSLEARIQWPHPDRYTAFLSSIYATSYEPIGSSIIDAGTPSTTGETVLVRSHSSPDVELSRVQLRAIMRIYSQGPPAVQNRPPQVQSKMPPVAVPAAEEPEEVPEAVSAQ